jgi:hypothetical protein
MALSFAKDIHPMFRDTDVDTMQNYGLDLSSYDEVRNKAQAIYTTLAEGTMPCDGVWPKETTLTAGTQERPDGHTRLH